MQPHFAPRARRVIFLFIQGGPSQLDLFDPKPLIVRKHGEKIRPPVDGNKVTIGVDKYLALAPVAPVRPRGGSGMMISDLMPHLASVADDLCLLRAVHTDNEAHAPATLQLHTGASIDVRPSMGSWFSYGLGTENENLPSFITIHPDSDVRTYGAGFLPAAHQGTPVNVTAGKEAAIRYLVDDESTADVQRRRLDLIQTMNRRLLHRVETDRWMEGHDRVVRAGLPDADGDAPAGRLSGETEATKESVWHRPAGTDRHGRACLLARRLSEAGVRFVQVTISGWDHHGNIRAALPESCAGSDRPVAGLIKDLKSRGLLDDTLVVWSGEFGRTPWSQDLSGHVADRYPRPRASTRKLLCVARRRRREGRVHPWRDRRLRLPPRRGEGPSPRPARHDAPSPGPGPRASHIPSLRPRLPADRRRRPGGERDPCLR